METIYCKCDICKVVSRIVFDHHEEANAKTVINGKV